MYLSNRATEITVQYIRHNNLWDFYKQAADVNDLKRLIATKLFQLNAQMIKGLKQVNWEAIYKLVQTI